MVVRARARTTIRKVEGGFPHSEIPGSKLVRSSPRLIAAYHVLLRLSAPRHPPNALKALDRSRDRCPPLNVSPEAGSQRTRSGRKKTSDQVVSDPTAVCLPNMTDDDRLSPRHQPHSLFTMLDIFAHPTLSRSHRALTLAAGGKLISLTKSGPGRLSANGLTRASSPRARRQARAGFLHRISDARKTRCPDLRGRKTRTALQSLSRQWDPDRSLVSNSASRGEPDEPVSYWKHP
ncbi:hypothetical protein Lal_00044880 [Lupinus albus]|nr:hypothetical protein Lal_00044880 [Lupinus albus]